MTDDRATDALDLALELAARLEGDLARFTREHGTTRARTHLLWLLGSLGPTRQGVLAGALDVSPRNVTGLVDALEADGLVTREADPDDRRAALVTLTPGGARVVDDLVEGRRTLATQLFGDQSEASLRAFARVTRAANARLEELGGTIGTG